jgi:hypothetical protein
MQRQVKQQPTVSQVLKLKRKQTYIHRFNFLKKFNFNALMQMAEKKEFRDGLLIPRLDTSKSDQDEFSVEKLTVQTVTCRG